MKVKISVENSQLDGGEYAQLMMKKQLINPINS